ncbi:hypothetical protein M9H77_20415 [Catharanthus roseus]|uniref:Uncharacterized protein n=1 Tax=Catharanthus roseus TaxID=4058 RepID=A0ACC0AJI7_CATRO|nr:hypothetical protein M9H77_20415 [Catharanthus roseus]
MASTCCAGGGYSTVPFSTSRSLPFEGRSFTSLRLQQSQRQLNHLSGLSFRSNRGFSRLRKSTSNLRVSCLGDPKERPNIDQVEAPRLTFVNFYPTRNISPRPDCGTILDSVNICPRIDGMRKLLTGFISLTKYKQLYCSKSGKTAVWQENGTASVVQHGKHRIFPADEQQPSTGYNRAFQINCNYATIVTGKSWNKLILQSDVPVLVEFYASWCGPCRMVHRVIDEIAADYSGRMKFFILNTDNDLDVAENYDIKAVPVVFLFKNGEKQESVIGTMPKEFYVAAIERIYHCDKYSTDLELGAEFSVGLPFLSCFKTHLLWWSLRTIGGAVDFLPMCCSWSDLSCLRRRPESVDGGLPGSTAAAAPSATLRLCAMASWVGPPPIVILVVFARWDFCI